MRGAKVEYVDGDITEQPVDAMVNAANSSLLGGWGVDGAIHERGGPDILAACRALRSTRYPDGLPEGDAVATTAGKLPAHWVIHTVGPVYSPSDDRASTLASCYTRSLWIAADLGAESIAFPAISTGAYKWPMADAARVAHRAVLSAAVTVPRCLFVLRGTEALKVWLAAGTRARKE